MFLWEMFFEGYKNITLRDVPLRENMDTFWEIPPELSFFEKYIIYSLFEQDKCLFENCEMIKESFEILSKQTLKVNWTFKWNFLSSTLKVDSLVSLKSFIQLSQHKITHTTLNVCYLKINSQSKLSK